MIHRHFAEKYSSHLLSFLCRYLQNNSLNGSVPDWLSGLKNLKELYVSLSSPFSLVPVRVDLYSIVDLCFAFLGYFTGLYRTIISAV